MSVKVENLQRLSDSYRQQAGRESPHRLDDSARSELASSWAKRIPLSHGASAERFSGIVKSGMVYSQQMALVKGLIEASGKKSDEEKLGTERAVFCYASIFRYPNHVVAGFFFKPDCENLLNTEAATPFDSGGLLEHLRPDLGVDGCKCFLREHEFPVPAYRNYLSLVLSGSFNHPSDYLNPETLKPLFDSAFGFKKGRDPRRWTFEVRFLNQIPVDMHHLEAVFFHGKNLTNAEYSFYQKALKAGLHVYRGSPRKGGFKDLQRAAYEHLTKTGGSQ